MSDRQEEEPSIIASISLNVDESALHHHNDSEGQFAHLGEDEDGSALPIFSDNEDDFAKEVQDQKTRATQAIDQDQERQQQQDEPEEEHSDLDEAIENNPEQDFSLVSSVTVVEALLLSGLNISADNALEALQLLDVLVDTVTSDQFPPFLKAMTHNVDTNAYSKLLKSKKVSGSASQDDFPERIAPHSACARCHHDPAVNKPALALLSCVNCKSVEYCSVQCQLADWMAHRNLYCVNPAVIPVDTLAKPHRVPFLKTHITNPFARLCKGIWLHDRHKQDVYALLIDSFRLREADDFTYGGMRNNDSIYSGRVSSCPSFRRFLYQAETMGLMPPWWSDQKRVECLTKGIDKRSDNYHDLHATTRDVEILVVYEDAIMTMQLRMFAESVLGKGAAGTNGKLMRQKMAVAEEAARGLAAK